jgi:signal peptidase I
VSRPYTRLREGFGEAGAEPATPLDTAAPALLAHALQAFGAVCLRVLGGSMKPAIHPRDILVVAGCRVDDLRPRDVVLVARDGRLIVHRLIDVGVRAGRRVLVTRGDALWFADAPVDAGDLLGRVVAVGRRGVFRAPAACTPLARARGLVASECTALRVRIQRWN